MSIRAVKTWEPATLGDLVDYRTEHVEPGAVSSDTPFLGLEHIQAGLGVLVGKGSPNEVRSTKSRFRAGDILYGKLRPYLNKVYVAREDGICSTDILVLQPRPGVLPSFIFCRLLSREFVSYASQNMSGVQHPRVSPKALSKFLFSVPPTREQSRIVDAVDALFSDLDAAVGTMDRALEKLKRYRQAVLKAAVEGELSREWREGHGFKTEDARAALLPPGWKSATLGELGTVTGGLTMNSKREGYALRLPYLTVANVYAGELRLDDIKEIGLEGGERNRVLLKKWDLLIVEGNGSQEQIGRVALWDDSVEPCVHQNHIIKVRFASPEISKWCELFLLSPVGRDQIRKVASSTSGLYTLSISKVSKLSIAVPAADEQSYIETETNRLLSIHDSLTAALRINLLRANRLRQSILEKAFRGELVPQDPNDEPASVLLERIRAERAAAANTKPVRPRRARSARIP